MKKSSSGVRGSRTRLATIVILAAVVGYGYYQRTTQVLPQAAIHFLEDVRLPQPDEKVLVFSPHPDDETIGAGGYIRESVDRRAEVRIILVTDGNKHGLESQRYHEFSNAARILGVKPRDLIFLNHPDGHLKNCNKTKLYAQFKGEIDSFAPTIVIYPNPADHHPDHSVVGQIVEAVLDAQPDRPTAYGYLVHHARFPQPKKLRPRLYLLPPIALATLDREWYRLPLPKSVEDRKSDAIRVYRTQLRVPILRSLLLSSIRQNELFCAGEAGGS